MLISDFAIRRPVITIVSMLALVVGGIIALFKLQTDEFPDVAPPYVSVAIPYPGASPETVEKELLDQERQHFRIRCVAVGKRLQVFLLRHLVLAPAAVEAHALVPDIV